MSTYKPSGICAREITFEIKDETVFSVNFTGGCSGNLKGISKLIEGMKVEEAITKLKGIKCGQKNTSCPDQLALALEDYIKTA